MAGSSRQAAMSPMGLHGMLVSGVIPFLLMLLPSGVMYRAMVTEMPASPLRMVVGEIDHLYGL